MSATDGAVAPRYFGKLANDRARILYDDDGSIIRVVPASRPRAPRCYARPHGLGAFPSLWKAIADHDRLRCAGQYDATPQPSCTDPTSVGPTADDWARYGKTVVNHTRNKPAANDDAPEAVLIYRNTPDTRPDPLASSWRIDPPDFREVEYDADEEDLVIVQYHVERYLEIRPTELEILRAMRHDWVENEAGQVVAIGPLRFADGERHYERADCNTKSGPRPQHRKMRTGAMLGTSEDLAGSKGGGASPSATELSNTHLTRLMLKTPTAKARRFTPRGKQRSGPSLTAAQSRALIAEAVANTPVMPAVTYCPPGVASGTAQYSHQFVGMKIGSTGKGGGINWVDFYVAGRDHDAWVAAVAATDETTRTVLNATMTARNYTDVGMSIGQSEAYARRRGGKMALQAANDNLAAALAA